MNGKIWREKKKIRGSSVSYCFKVFRSGSFICRLHLHGNNFDFYININFIFLLNSNSLEYREEGQDAIWFAKLSHEILLLTLVVFSLADQALFPLESKQQTTIYEMDQSKYIWSDAG